MGQHKYNPNCQLAREGKLPPKPKKMSKRHLERLTEGTTMGNAYKFVPLDLHGKNKNAEKPVVTVLKDGRICRFPSVRDAARLMGIPEPNIVACLKGRLKTAGGYNWKYDEN